MVGTNAGYWKTRFGQVEQSQHKIGASAYADIEKQYRKAQREIEGQINAWYGRFATNNNVTIGEARRMLSARELAELKWDVREYIRYGEENALNGKWLKELENASARYHISRLEALKLQTQQSLEVMFGNQLDTIDVAMREAYKSGFYRTAFEIQKGIGVGWDFGTLDEKQIAKVINKPWAADGSNFSQRVWGNRQKLVNELNQTLTQNIVLGQDPQKAIDVIAKKMNTSKHNAGRLVMTEEAYFSSEAQRECFKELDVEEYEIVATLDSHTSEICQEMDGKHFLMSQWEVGATAPPFHVYCRTTTVPYFADDFGSAGERAARGGDGKTYQVPANMTYKEWKEKFVDGGDKSWLKKASENDTIANMITDITKGYAQQKTGGRVIFEGNYDKRTHLDEIAIADWLKSSFGGNVVLLSETKAKGIKTPDCIWDGKDWEFKTISSSKYGTIDSRIHKAYKQISDNLGGMVLDFTGSELDLDEAVEMVTRSLATRGKDNFTVIVKKGEQFKVFKITKE